ncbi:helix-turn-helix transcriptional regulator [Herbaspirillum sp. LeCh32-8]|uniref:AraC family transcriptional regulator n=1 Tax=Herbaspirillum sp. LeCh32-8 TaxID=2821356 RepID=UPI001AE935DD|nr:helix-turn-helix transcriptional regulator [Herbaspirillum sp. LeCh32-8]MBP0598869.1 helix-turn-helix transcriptional regulator [Herbaspirillum sp. LeCh32-8]
MSTHSLPNPDLCTPIVVGRVDQCSPERPEPHRHQRYQFMCATTGVVHLWTSQGEWVLPPSRAVLIKSQTDHSSWVTKPAEIRTLYIDEKVAPDLGEYNCALVNVSPLMRELITVCADLPWNYEADSKAARMAQVLIDQIQEAAQAPVAVPLPQDPRAARIVETLRLDPGNKEPLSELAKQVGASTRTIERLFLKETRMTFGAWRHRHRLVTAVSRLAYGEQVNSVALEVGYESTSSFIAAFRATFGTTPARYFKA